MNRVNHPYLNRQLFAYIGNKRALLPFLEKIFSGLSEDVLLRGNSALRFYDPFAGTGSVARLARLMGFSVHANDWERYSWIYNGSFLSETMESAEHLFQDLGGLEKTMEKLNAEGRRAAESGLDLATPAYISRYYAPPVTSSADYRKHRLFYSAENARFIDRVRHLIQTDFRRHRQKNLLLSLLLCEAGTHANTSGVFKSCHKGFGGYGADALGRILSPMELEIPALPRDRDIVPDQEICVTGADATRPSGKSYDLVYLDPPYNGHQYGSNYFMLNTIAKWDRLPADQGRGADGRYRSKAAIRSDWVHTKSPFCYADQSTRAFSALLDNLDSPNILLSYNTEGIIPFERLVDIMASQGRVRILTKDYVTYRGGRQSNTREMKNLEFLLHLDRRSSSKASDLSEINRIKKIRRLEKLCTASFYPEKILELSRDGLIKNHNGSEKLSIQGLGQLEMPGYFEFPSHAQANIKNRLPQLDSDQLDTLDANFQAAVIPGHLERAKQLLALIRETYRDETYKENGDPGRRDSLKQRVDSLFWSLKKFAFKKYQPEFDQLVAAIEREIGDGTLPDVGSRLDLLKKRVAPRLRQP